jgi:hypothetical protein
MDGFQYSLAKFCTVSVSCCILHLHCMSTRPTRRYLYIRRYTVKKRLMNFPSPAGMSLTKLSLGGIILIIPGQGEFGKWHPGWGGKIAILFLQCTGMLCMCCARCSVITGLMICKNGTVWKSSVFSTATVVFCMHKYAVWCSAEVCEYAEESLLNLLVVTVKLLIYLFQLNVKILVTYISKLMGCRDI